MVNEIYFTEFPELESDRLVMRKQSVADVDSIYILRSDKNVMKYMDSNCQQSRSEAEKFVSENTEVNANGKGLFWMLVERESGQVIGDFAFWQIDKNNRLTEIGYTLSPEYWGKGYMKEAMAMAIDFGFDKLGLHRIEANINPGNDGSRRLLQASGFIKEGTVRENIFYNGGYWDSELYGLLATDWEAKKNR